MKPQETQEKRKKYRTIRDLILDIGSQVDTVVVDGVHDRKTLKHLGFEAPVFTLSERPYAELAELIAKKYSTVAILTDFDDAGRHANEILSQLFEQKHIKICYSCREGLQALLSQEQIATIEGIYSLIAK